MFKTRHLTTQYSPVHIPRANKRSLQLNGTDEYVSGGSGADTAMDFGTEDWSYGCWFKHQQYIDGSATSDNAKMNPGGWYGTDGTDHWYSFWNYSAGAYGYFWTSRKDGGKLAEIALGGEYLWRDTGALEDRWTHVIVTHDRSQTSNGMKWYMNGKEMTTFTGSTTGDATDIGLGGGNGFQIGKYNVTYDAMKIHNFYKFNTVITPRQVMKLHNNGRYIDIRKCGINPDNLELYWIFDGHPLHSDIANVYDLSGSDNDGTIINCDASNYVFDSPFTVGDKNSGKMIGIDINGSQRP